MTNVEALAKLKELSLQLDKVEFSDIIDLLKNSIQKIPVPIAKLHPNTAIDRARKNEGEKLFKSVDQLSYITDPYVIQNILTEFGRANNPHEALFYAAVESTLIGHQRITAIAETSKLFQERRGVSFDGELYTVSRWRNSEELLLAEVVFAQAAIDINPDTKKAFEAQSEFAKSQGTEDIDFYLDFLVFISEQFARPAVTHNDYKISTAYKELIFSKPNIHGIAFPSVQTNYYGQNIVLPPSIVDKYLSVEVLATQRLYKNHMKTLLNNHKNCMNPKDCYNDIQWADLDAKYMSTSEHIQDFLNSA